MKNFDFPYINDSPVDLSGIEGATDNDDERYYSAFVQHDPRYRGGLYGVWDNGGIRENGVGRYVALGPAGKMRELSNLLNEFGVKR